MMRRRILLVVGGALFVGSLPLYVSHDSRIVLQRWSYPYTAVLLASGLGWMAIVAGVWRSARRRPSPARAGSAWVAAFDVAVLLWGLAYSLSALDAPANAGRILDLNIIGSVHPLAAMLEWLALVAGGLAAILLLAPRVPVAWRDPGLMIVAIMAIAILGEGIARAKAILAPETHGFPTYSARLWSRRHVSLNTLGLRDVEHSLQTRRGSQRLLLVGDSYTFGTGVSSVAERFGEQLAARLNDRAPGAVEVINAGRSDSHTLDHIETLRRMLRFRPDLVVLLYVFNDMDYLHPLTTRGAITDPNGLLGRLHPLRVLYVNSYAFQELHVRARRLYHAWRAPQVADDPYFDESLLQRHFMDLERFVALAQRAGVQALLVPFDNLVGANSRRRVRYVRFVTRARKVGLPVCELRFDGVPVEKLQVNKLDGHPSALANRLAATQALDCLTIDQGRLVVMASQDVAKGED